MINFKNKVSAWLRKRQKLVLVSSLKHVDKWLPARYFWNNRHLRVSS